MSLNTLILTGNLGGEPRITTTTTGRKKVSLVHGEKRTHTYTDAQGVEREAVELVAEDFHLLARKSPGAAH